MGVLNMTPDSFSDGGSYFVNGKPDCATALKHAELMQSEGAAWIDVGGESTRPGSEPISVQQELDRVIPVVEQLVQNVNCKVSIDTSSPEVMLEAANVGAALVNDVRALKRSGALQAVAKTGLKVCLMHMRGEPKTMQHKPQYGSVVDEVKTFFEQRLLACEKAGIGQEKIILDPGFGFGKTLQHNLQLLNQLGGLAVRNCPLLIGVSRKSMIGQLLNKPVDQRVYGGVALAAIAVMKGIAFVRTHDVAATVDAIKIAAALRDIEQA
jgi:dihydropteroate synthase